jgi:hypothetical protein
VAVSDPSDVALARAFERGEISNAGFHHASHLRVAWVYLHEHASVDEATAAIAATIRTFAVSVGKAEKFDRGVTVFWMKGARRRAGRHARRHARRYPAREAGAPGQEPAARKSHMIGT